MSASEEYFIDDVYSWEIEGVPVKSGDLICTVDGSPSSLPGQFWWFIGKLIPGAIDHIVIYTGPEGRCVEAGAKGKVITFDIQGNRWDGNKMYSERGFIDDLYGVAYPLDYRDLLEDRMNEIRLDVSRYCLKQAEEQKPYNFNFLHSDTENAFYCSQLAYKAYIQHGINLNSEKEVPNIPFTKSIVFPQEVWAACLRTKKK